MTPETITAAIDALAAKLSIPSSQLLELLPRIGWKNAYVLYVALAVLAVALILGLVSLIFAITTDKDVAAGACLIFGTIAGMALLVSIGCIPDYFFWKNEPEAWAVDYIFKLLQSPK